MKRVLEIIEYLNACAQAIFKGIQITANNWPVNSPFDIDELEQKSGAIDEK